MSANSSRARKQIAMKPSQCFGTPTVECPLGGDVRKYASAEERTAKAQKTTVRHFGFTEKVYGLPCTATPKQWTALPHATRGAKRKKASGARSKYGMKLQCLKKTRTRGSGTHFPRHTRDLCTFDGSAMVFSGDFCHVQMRLMLASRLISYGSMFKLCTYPLTCVFICVQVHWLESLLMSS